MSLFLSKSSTIPENCINIVWYPFPKGTNLFRVTGQHSTLSLIVSMVLGSFEEVSQPIAPGKGGVDHSWYSDLGIQQVWVQKVHVVEIVIVPPVPLVKVKIRDPFTASKTENIHVCFRLTF